MANDPAPLASLSISHVYYNPNDPVSYLCAWLALVPQGLCIVYATLVWSTREAEVALAFAGQLGCEVVNLILKRLIKEERPRHRHSASGVPVMLDSSSSSSGGSGGGGASIEDAQLHHLPFRRGYGMPSSHAQFAGYWAVTIALFLLVRYRGHGGQGGHGGHGGQQQRRHRCWHHPGWSDWSLIGRVGTSAAAFVMALLIAWSRVYLHYHTANQVLAGFAAGLAVGAAWFVATALARRWGLLRWALSLPPAQWLRIRDLAAEEDAAQAGWEKWQLRLAAQEARQIQAAAKKA